MIVFFFFFLSLRFSQVITDKNFRFGVEYSVQGLGEAYSLTGSKSSKPAPELVHWGVIQKTEKSEYTFDRVDEIVKEYQDSGFKNIQLILFCGCKWAQIDSKHQNPKPEYEDDYVRFVESVVDRYNMNGYSRMPGLKYSVVEFGVEREFSGYYNGNGTEYVHLLKLAYPAIKRNNSDAKVLLNALPLSFIFQGNPNESVIEKRITQPWGLGTHTWNDVMTLLDATDFYDIIDFHFLGDYSEIPATMKWINKELEKRGVKKVVYGGDVFPMYTLFDFTFIYNCKLVKDAQLSYPVSHETKCDAQEVLDSRIHKLYKDHEKSKLWFEKHTSLNIPKKFTVAAAEGLSGLNIGNLEDWPIIPGFAGASFFGMMDTHIVGQKRIPVADRPSFKSLKATIDHLRDFKSVKRIIYSENIYLYLFDEDVWVGWYDEGVFYGLDETTPNKTINVDVFEKGIYDVKVVATVRNEEYSQEFSLKSSNFTVKLELGYVPLFMKFSKTIL